MFPSGLNILAVIVGFLFIGYYLVESYKLMKKSKDKTTAETEE